MRPTYLMSSSSSSIDYFNLSGEAACAKQLDILLEWLRADRLPIQENDKAQWVEKLQARLKDPAASFHFGLACIAVINKLQDRLNSSKVPRLIFTADRYYPLNQTEAEILFLQGGQEAVGNTFDPYLTDNIKKYYVGEIQQQLVELALPSVKQEQIVGLVDRLLGQLDNAPKDESFNLSHFLCILLPYCPEQTSKTLLEKHQSYFDKCLDTLSKNEKTLSTDDHWKIERIFSVYALLLQSAHQKVPAQVVSALSNLLLVHDVVGSVKTTATAVLNKISGSLSDIDARDLVKRFLEQLPTIYTLKKDAYRNVLAPIQYFQIPFDLFKHAAEQSSALELSECMQIIDRYMRHLDPLLQESSCAIAKTIVGSQPPYPREEIMQLLPMLISSSVWGVSDAGLQLFQTLMAREKLDNIPGWINACLLLLRNHLNHINELDIPRPTRGRVMRVMPVLETNCGLVEGKVLAHLLKQDPEQSARVMEALFQYREKEVDSTSVYRVLSELVPYMTRTEKISFFHMAKKDVLYLSEARNFLVQLAVHCPTEFNVLLHEVHDALKQEKRVLECLFTFQEFAHHLPHELAKSVMRDLQTYLINNVTQLMDKSTSLLITLSKKIGEFDFNAWVRWSKTINLNDPLYPYWLKSLTTKLGKLAPLLTADQIMVLHQMGYQQLDKYISRREGYLEFCVNTLPHLSQEQHQQLISKAQDPFILETLQYVTQALTPAVMPQARPKIAI